MLNQEGQAQFEIGSAFFRPQAQTARELGLLAAAVHRAEVGQLRVLEAMGGCGIRAVRYGLEAQADFVWTNDGNPEVQSTLAANLARNLPPDRYCLTQEEAARLLARCFVAEDFYDLVDVDAFGNPSAYFAPCISATKLGGLIYLTGTDGRALAGHAPETSLRAYGAYARSHPSAQEQGLRLLIGGLWQAAAARGLGIAPLFSYFGIQTYRVMVRLLPRMRESSAPSSVYGFLGYCHHCGEYQCLNWRQLSRALCPHHSPPLPLTLSGPLWLGPLHSQRFLGHMSQQAQDWHWPQHLPLLSLMAAEAELPPYFFPLGEIGRRGQMDPPGRDRLLHTLQAQGYAASPTHLCAQALKTNASLHHCIQTSRQLSLPLRQDLNSLS